MAQPDGAGKPGDVSDTALPGKSAALSSSTLIEGGNNHSLSAASAVSSFVSTRLDHSAPVLQSPGVRNLGCLRGLVLEAMAFSRDFVTAVTPVEPLTFNVCKGTMSVGVVKAIRGRVQGG